MGCWSGFLSGARCRLAYGPAHATATRCLASVKSRLVFTFLVPAPSGSPGKGPLNGCVCVCTADTPLLCVYCVFVFMTVLWFGSRVVSVLDSGTEVLGFKSQSQRCRVTVLGKLFTPIILCSLSSNIGSSPLRACGGNCRPGRK